MTYSEPARTRIRRIPKVLAVGSLVVVATIAAAFGHQVLASSSSTAAAPFGFLRSEHRNAFGEAAGAVPGRVTIFAGGIPAVANLDPALLGALRRAATDAAGDGIDLYVTSGWRSPAYQERLLREAVTTYGSKEEAARWVAPPESSAHVSGDAVDLGPVDAVSWMSEHGSEYGLCQIYSNEPWHYELRPEAVDRGCPAMFVDAAHDPRLRQ